MNRFLVIFTIIASNAINAQIGHLVYIDISHNKLDGDTTFIERQPIIDKVNNLIAENPDSTLVYLSNGANSVAYGYLDKSQEQLEFDLNTYNTVLPSPDEDLKNMFELISKYGGIHKSGRFSFFLSNRNCTSASNHVQVLLEQAMLSTQSRPGYEKITFYLYLTQGYLDIRTIKEGIIDSVQIHPLN